MVKKIKLVFVAVLGTAVVALSTHAIATIKDTRHNLSSSGMYTVKATTESQICKFCHAPHNADSSQAPLWNHQESTTLWFDIASTTYIKPGKSQPNMEIDSQPTGISKKCLSCHDGSISIGAVLNGGPITVTGASGGAGDQLASGDYGYISPTNSPGNSLNKGHVISFQYNAARVTQLNIDYGDPARYKNMSAAFEPSMLDRTKRMHCHTCHDPHNDWCDDGSSKIGKDPLWRLPCGSGGQGNARVCEKCHNQTYDYYTAPDYPF